MNTTDICTWLQERDAYLASLETEIAALRATVAQQATILAQAATLAESLRALAPAHAVPPEPLSAGRSRPQIRDRGPAGCTCGVAREPSNYYPSDWHKVQAGRRAKCRACKNAVRAARPEPEPDVQDQPAPAHPRPRACACGASDEVAFAPGEWAKAQRGTRPLCRACKAAANRQQRDQRLGRRETVVSAAPPAPESESESTAAVILDVAEIWPEHRGDQIAAREQAIIRLLRSVADRPDWDRQTRAVHQHVSRLKAEIAQLRG